MGNKRYTDGQAIALLARLTGLEDAPGGQGRMLFMSLLKARLGAMTVSTAEQVVGAATDETIAGLQKGVYAYLHLVLGMDRAPAARRWPDVTLKAVTLTMSGPDDLRLEVSGSLNTLLTVQVNTLLHRVGDRLRKCDCGRLYVRVRRQRYCSEQCQKRYYMRRFRAGEAGKE